MRDSRIVIGVHSIREAIKIRPSKVSGVFLRDKWKESPELKELAEFAQKNKVVVKQVTNSFLDKYGRNHQGVAAEITEVPELDLAVLKNAETALIVVLDQVEDPQNLGAVMRTAWLMGANAVVIPKDRTATVTPTVAKIASGAMEHMPVEVVTNLTAWLKDRREENFWIYGFDAGGKSTHWQVKFPEKVILVLGAEGHGLRKATTNACDEILRIPQGDSDASYNVSVSAALAMGEVVRQRAGK